LGLHVLQTVDDNALAGFQTGEDDALTADVAPERHLAISNLVVAIDDEDELLALIIANGAIGNRDHVAIAAATELHRNEHARHELAVLVVEFRPRADRARRRADAIVEAVDGALVEASSIALNGQLDGDFALLVLRVGFGVNALQIGLL